MSLRQAPVDPTVRRSRFTGGAKAIGVLTLFLACGCAQPQTSAVWTTGRPLDPLVLRIPFADSIPCEDADARWEELANIDSLHTVAFGLPEWYHPSSALTGSRCSPLEDLPYDMCLRIAGTAASSGLGIDEGAVSILIVLDGGRGAAQMRVISLGVPWSPIGVHFKGETRPPSLLGAHAILDTTIQVSGARARRMIARAAELCATRAPMSYPDERAVGAETWTLEVRERGIVCRGLEQANLDQHEVWSDLVLETLLLFGYTVETIQPLIYREVAPEDFFPPRALQRGQG